MKRYERINHTEEQNQTIEEMAVGMLIAYIAEEYEIEEIQNDNSHSVLINRFNGSLKWLDEKVGE